MCARLGGIQPVPHARQSLRSVHMAPQGSDVAQRGYGYEDHDLVVALPHLGLVTRKLEDSILQSARDLSPETPPPAVFFD